MVTVTGNTGRRPDTGSGDRPSASPARDEPPDPATRNRPDRNRGALPRRSHSIRFSDPEWSLIEQAAGRHGLSAPELIRLAAVALAQERLPEHPPVSLSSGHIALIEATWRAVNLLATIATRKMPYQEIDNLVAAAQNAMLQTMNKGPQRNPPHDAPSTGRRKLKRRARRARHTAPGSDLF